MPAFIVDDVRALAAAISAAGHAVVDDEPLEGYDRVYVSDPFGNRIELMQPLTVLPAPPPLLAPPPPPPLPPPPPMSATTEGQVGDRSERLHHEARQPEPLAPPHEALGTPGEVDQRDSGDRELDRAPAMITARCRGVRSSQRFFWFTVTTLCQW